MPGGVGFGLLWQFRQGQVLLGKAVELRQGGDGWAMCGKERQGSYGKLSQGTLRCAEVRSGRHINQRKFRKEKK